MATTEAARTAFESRAVTRRIEAGSSVTCLTCDEQIKFSAKDKRDQVICNVYVDGSWDHVEHHHAECYAEAGEPYGTPQPDTRRKSKGRSG